MQQSSLQLNLSLVFSSYVHVIHFTSELLPLQKPKRSLLKPTHSLLPQSEAEF